MRYYLVDNGSLRAASVLNLRQVAAALSARIGSEIIPASLLHSSRVPADELDGIAAVNLERRLKLDYAAGERAFRIIPFFFGPTGAITDYLPKRLAFLREHIGPMQVDCCPFLFPGNGQPHVDLVSILRDRVVEQLLATGWQRPPVALVDHGSPLPSVAAVRDQLALDLAAALGDDVAAVAPCSMERREGTEYAFNEPLLESLLRDPQWRGKSVIVAMLFLSPGRHAGPDGDVDSICSAAHAEHHGLQTRMTGLVGTHPGMVDVLQNRFQGPWEPL